MYSISFPKMFNGLKTSLYKDTKATASNLWLLLNSSKLTLFGDPFFGTSIKRAIFEQNDGILLDLVVDEIYTNIKNFMPQINISRNDITLTQKGIDVICNIKCVDLTDYTINTYSINLTSDEGA